MEILPAIDLLNGQCVRLKKGDYNTQSQVAADPIAVARAYRDAGAKLIHVVDLDGARDGVRKNRALVESLVQAAAPARVELGGGLRTMRDLEDADALGVWRFVLGSVAVSDPAFVAQAVARFGERIVVGVDAHGGNVATHGWQESSGRDYLSFAREMEAIGVSTLVFTDIDTDGMLTGPNWERLRTLREAVSCRIVASGGVSSLEDLDGIAALRVEEVIIGKALYSGAISLEAALQRAQLARLFQKSELIPAVIQHAETKQVLMVGFTNREAVEKTLATGLAWFYSRSRQRLWQKGESSGHVLRVKTLYTDCDEDTLLLLCEPMGPTCHTGETSCFFREIPLSPATNA